MSLSLSRTARDRARPGRRAARSIPAPRSSAGSPDAAGRKPVRLRAGGWRVSSSVVGLRSSARARRRSATSTSPSRSRQSVPGFCSSTAQELHERLDRVARRAEIGLADPLVAMVHEGGQRLVGDQMLGRVAEREHRADVRRAGPAGPRASGSAAAAPGRTGRPDRLAAKLFSARRDCSA